MPLNDGPAPPPAPDAVGVCWCGRSTDATQLVALVAEAFASGAAAVTVHVAAVPADLRLVDALARAALVARRLGRRLDVRAEGPSGRGSRFRDAGRELSLDEVLELVGLRDLLGRRGGGAVGVEVRGQAEPGEQPGLVEEHARVEERVHVDDLPG
jgi:hypothetical protein